VIAPPDLDFVLTDRRWIGHPVYWQHILEISYHLSASTLLGVMPHALVNEAPGSSRIRSCPLRKAVNRIDAKRVLIATTPADRLSDKARHNCAL
jgi:hypothetical protein